MGPLRTEVTGWLGGVVWVTASAVRRVEVSAGFAPPLVPGVDSSSVFVAMSVTMRAGFHVFGSMVPSQMTRVCLCYTYKWCT